MIFRLASGFSKEWKVFTGFLPLLPVIAFEKNQKPLSPAARGQWLEASGPDFPTHGSDLQPAALTTENFPSRTS
jgi:hypothetical protein